MLFKLETISKHGHQVFIGQTDPGMRGISNIEPPSLKSVETWIMVAWNFFIDEIVNEIIGTDENIFGLLEALHSNTPKDLITYWGRHPKLLLKTMGDHPKHDDDLFHD